jgi:hypothetical protein
MKKTIVLLPLLIFLALTVNAQRNKVPATAGWRVGIGAMNLSGNLRFGGTQNYTITEAYTALYFDLQLRKKLFFQGGVGFSYAEGLLFPELSILLKYQASRKIEFVAGPRLDVLLDLFSYGDYEFTPAGVAAEAGVNYNFTSRLFGELRLSRSVTNQLNIPNSDLFSGGRTNIRLGAGIRF